MAEKKNLVIKVKLPVTAQSGDASLSNPKVITVWNVPRIAGAGGAVLGFILLLALLFAGDDETEDRQAVVDNTVERPLKTVVSEQPPALPVAKRPAEQPKVVAAQPTSPAPLPDDAARVRRALLTTRVIGKEPGPQISQPLTIKPGQLVTVYYFTELRGMNGKTLYHEWLHNGLQVAKEPLLVEAERWRVTTHRTLEFPSAGQWAVRLTDRQGMLLDEKYFTVNASQ